MVGDKPPCTQNIRWSMSADRLHMHSTLNTLTSGQHVRQYSSCQAVSIAHSLNDESKSWKQASTTKLEKT